MKVMGIRDLKARMSEAIREVRGGETIEITYHGEVVAVLVPARREASQEDVQAALASMDSLAAEIGRHITQRTNVAQTISDMRR
jgi:prevent-host-death family protein